EHRFRDCGDLIADIDELIAGKTPKTVILEASKSSVALQHGAVPARPVTAKAPLPKFLIVASASAMAMILLFFGLFQMMKNRNEEKPPIAAPPPRPPAPAVVK